MKGGATYSLMVTKSAKKSEKDTENHAHHQQVKPYDFYLV